MSAITGIFYRDGRNVDEKQIKKMNDRLSHRGPDGSAIWCEGPVALGHQMLHTTPESLHEKLPFEEDGLVITADARIDNRKELSEKLEIEDKEEVSDSYFILKAYQKWGEKSPEELLGDFAFAIWDKDQEKLFCARDHMGVKPFYYYLNDEVFYFATEIKAIFTNPEVPCKLNLLMATFYLIPNADETKITFYNDILRLPAANSLKIVVSSFSLKKYWELNPDLKIIMDSDEKYSKKFREIFNEAIKCRLRASFPVGFELSGGLDSSSIVTIVKNNFMNYVNNINTFSMITKDFPECDEGFYIQKLVESGGIIPYFLSIDEISPLDDFENIEWHIEQPLFSPNSSFFWNMYKTIQNNNIRIIFRGYDGDSVLSRGQNYFKELFIKFKWKTLAQEIQAFSKHREISTFKIIFTKIIYPLMPLFIKDLYRNKKRLEADFVFNNKYLEKKLKIKEKYKKFDRYLVNPNTAKEFHYRLITQGSHQFSFEYLDKFIASFHIEPRYPYFDKRLVEFCYAIPTEQKFKHGFDRILLRESIKELPEEIKWRMDKKFFTRVSEKNLIEFEKNCLEEIIYNKRHLYRFWIDSKDLIEIYDKYKYETKDYEISDARDIWKIVTLLLWLQNDDLAPKFFSKN